MVLDADQVGALRRYIREGAIDETTALMDDIAEVGIGGHYLGRRSTRSHARSEVWRPALFARGGGEAGAPLRPLLERAVEYAHGLLGSHAVAPLDESAEREIDAILAAHEARRK
jgi:trimethylamine:corrinoid methyltransferase-like protein